ncbi:MAG: Ig-like domain-containing protein [Deltaproteobacteria bacterium]|nr:Ig-like domain-containing protein [Deltaproteobacteria bacterium]
MHKSLASALMTTLALSGSAVHAQSDEAPQGIYVPIPKPRVHAIPFGPGPKHRVIFLNRSGGTFSPGNDDSSQNISSIPRSVARIPPWSHGDEKWEEFVACMKDMFGRFDVEVTDVDPGATAHIEAVIGGTPGLVGLGSNVGGVAPMFLDCSVVERAVTYTFSEVFRGDPQSTCQVAAQEIAHSFGLDHEVLCEDPMTYLSGCGAKTFQDKDAPCGEKSARTCMCGGSTQNSVQVLLSVLGPAPDRTPPTAIIISPPDSSLVLPGFTVETTAEDNTGIARVELHIDGTLVESDETPPYSFSTPKGLEKGEHRVEVRAVDGQGNTTPDSVRVKLVSCTTNSQCSTGQHCSAGECVATNDKPNGSDPGGGGNPGAGGDDPVGDPATELVGGCQLGGKGGGLGASPLALALCLTGLGLRRRQRRSK